MVELVGEPTERALEPDGVGAVRGLSSGEWLRGARVGDGVVDVGGEVSGERGERGGGSTSGLGGVHRARLRG
jgi:hypothetical protein